MTTKHSVSARERLNRQLARVDDPTDNQSGSANVDVSSLLLDVARDHDLDFDIAPAITSGYIERTMDGATTLSVTIRDPRNALIRSGMFGDGTFFRFDKETPYRDTVPHKPHFRAIDVRLDGLWFRLVQLQKQGPELTLTFEDRVVAYLKLHNSPRSASRARITRAQFIRMLVHEIKAQDINFVSPELDIKQPIDSKSLKRPTDDVKKKRRKNRAPGLLSTVGLNVKGAHATRTQLENAEYALETASALGANRKVMVAEIMTTIQESGLSNAATNGSHVGMYQQDSTPGSSWRAAGGASRDPVKDSQAFVKAAMAADKANPGLSLPALCEAVQRSGQGSLYGKWTKEAKKFVDAYLGGSGGGSVGQRYYYKSYQYHRGRPDGPRGENTWDCSKRLADEVGWRRFVVGNSFFYVKDDDLIRAKPVDSISEDDDGVDAIDWDIDSDKPVSEATVECKADRWFAHQGEVILLEDQGPATGRWLVWTIHRDLFSTDCTITLRVPEAVKPEPAPELATVSTGADASGIVTGGTIGGKGARERIVKAAELAASYNKSKYIYLEVRPIPKSLFGKGMIRTDCSGFVTLCYKAAGLQDPNGNNYNGSGNTGTLASHGRKIHAGQLKPGDLVFYGGGWSYPGHVAIYADNGQVISFGSPGGPRILPINYRGDLLGYCAYNLTAGADSGFIGLGPGPWKGGLIR
jgi:hypothetical protein